MGASGIGVLARHIAHRVIGGVLIRHVTQVGDGMNAARIAIRIRAFAPARHAIQIIVAVRLMMIGDGRSGGRGAAVIAAGGRTVVPIPHQPTQIIVTIRLIIGFCSATRCGDGSEQLNHVADGVIDTSLTEEGLVLSGHRRTFRQQTVNAVIVLGSAEERIGWRDRFGAGTAERQSHQLPIVGVVDLAHQEVYRVGAARRAKVDRLRAPIDIIVRGDGLPIGIGQTCQFPTIVVDHIHRLREGSGIRRRDRERTLA